MMVMVAVAMMMVMMIPHPPAAETAAVMMVVVMARAREQPANRWQYDDENDKTEHCNSPSAEAPAL